MLWEPGQALPHGYYTLPDFAQKFFITFYSSILAVLGNDIYPATLF